MTKVAYLDCPTGLAGDMCLGALVDAGVPLEYLIEQLQRLGLADEYQLSVEKVQRQGQAATKVHVQLTSVPSSHGHRHLPQIESLIQSADFAERVELWSLKIFRTLAIAEGAVHGIAPEKVHFHEVGATDALVDIVGTCLGLDYLGIERLYCSALPTGSGTVTAAHGRLSVPVPAVLHLFQSRQVPIYDNGIQSELVTPTGAAIAVSLVESFGTIPAMNLEKIGLGAGSKNFLMPNILRLWLGTCNRNPTSNGAKSETIVALETQLDDLNPQVLGYLFEILYKNGAAEVFTQAIGMKKSRPGILLTVLCHPTEQQRCQDIIFRETTTLGIRVLPQQRFILDRTWESVDTLYGSVRIKLAYSPEKVLLNLQPEFEDCANLARRSGHPWQRIHQAAIASWHNQERPSS